MIMRENRVRLAYKEGRPAFGLYVMTAAPRMIELMGFAGMDFVRIDMEGGHLNIETVEDMIRTAHAVGVTPFVRVQGPHEWQIKAVLKMGALGVIIPKVSGVDDVQAAVRAAKQPPAGERYITPAGPTGGYGLVDPETYRAWADEHVVLSAQIETRSGVEQIEEIARIPGLDMVQSGRGDLSYHYGVPGKQYHPLVLEAERRVIDAGLAAGKMTSVQYYPLRDPEDIHRIHSFIDLGVLCLSLGSDADIVPVHRRLLSELTNRRTPTQP